MLPMSKENRTSPPIDIDTANMISATNVLVLRFCPRELNTRNGGKKKVGQDDIFVV